MARQDLDAEIDLTDDVAVIDLRDDDRPVRRRLRRTLRRVLLVALVLTLLVVGGGGWYYSSQLLAVPNPLDWRPESDVANLTSFVREHEDAALPVFGLDLATTYVTVGLDVAGTTCLGEVPDSCSIDTRPFAGLDPSTPAILDVNAFRDPGQAGLPFEDVAFTGELGRHPSWFVPGASDAGPSGAGPSDTWVVVVHGRGNTRAEGLRLATILHDLGHPALLISYRNDFLAPFAEDRVGRFGATEWKDLEAAVTFALGEGADDVILAGFSQGGSLVASFLRESPRADAVRGVFLDSPLLDLPETLVLQGRNAGIPGPLVGPVLVGTDLISRVRARFDAGALDHLADAEQWLQVPTLLIHGTADEVVPVSTSDELASRVPTVTYERFAGVGHVRAWNVDRDRYADAVERFLSGL